MTGTAVVAMVLALAATGAEDKSDVAAIRSTIARFDQAYQGKDVDAMTGLIAHDPETVFYSADLGDRWVGWAAIRAGLTADLKRIRSATVDPQPATVHVRGNLAWFERMVVMNLVVREGEMSILARCTGVLEKREGKWLFVQSHTSVGAPRDSTPRD